MTVPVRRILLVEDDRAWSLLTQEAFRDAAPDVGVEVAPTGEDALALLDGASPPDVVVLDLNLPGMTGVDLLRAIRARERGAAQSVVVMSASIAAADLEAVQGLGVTRYQQKPTTYGELRDFAARVVHGEAAASV